jgi:hypothetical protein
MIENRTVHFRHFILVPYSFRQSRSEFFKINIFNYRLVQNISKFLPVIYLFICTMVLRIDGLLMNFKIFISVHTNVKLQR